MKNLKIYSFFLLTLTVLFGCKKEDKMGNYPGGVVSPYISIFDVRDIYKGTDVTLSKSNMYGSAQLTAVVVSDHSGKNLPAGLLVVQDRRRLSQLRGISLNIGAEAANYVPGDSVTINIEGGVLTRANGILQITGVAPTAIKKISSGNAIPVNRVPANLVVANPENYESTLIVLVKAGFNPLPAANAVLAGDKMLNDGFADLPIHTEATATFANSPAPFLANFYGIVFTKNGNAGKLTPEFRLRTANDIAILSSTIDVSPVIITGFMSDVVLGTGGDGNYEYVQLMATRDINFAETPFSVVFTNNATASTPQGAPVNGWATGGMRTYKMNITSGSAAKGSFFYVGGSAKLINGVSSTNISSANWVRSYNYTTTDGDGFGTKTSGLLANSGNASGIAVFAGTAVTAATKPIDVIFVGANGTLYAAPSSGYRITNTDFYDVRNPITLVDQPFYRSGTNTISLSYNTADLGIFNMLGGEYNPTLGRWMKARIQNNVLLTKTSAISEIEGPTATKLVQ